MLGRRQVKGFYRLIPGNNQKVGLINQAPTINQAHIFNHSNKFSGLMNQTPTQEEPQKMEPGPNLFDFS
jgi:hypothetical protein